MTIVQNLQRISTWGSQFDSDVVKYQDQLKYHNNPPNPEALLEEVRKNLAELRSLLQDVEQEINWSLGELDD